MSKTKDFVVVWKDAPDPEWADEMIYDLKDLADPEGGLVNLLVNGFRIKRGRLPVVSCRARKGTIEQQAVHDFLNKLAERLESVE
ncbi:MAG: hypothetical protein E6Q97_19200 [Desulfurellales bacterium]|nr:MAG: hypothetical protein E6Q97_19200 [Desulfurellales bacterium]